MAKAGAPARSDDLYHEDFYVWTRQQSELLRAGRFAELDLPHLVEEIEDLGTSQRKEVFSRTQQIIRHLLKLHHSASAEPRQNWRRSVRDQRDELELALTPSLRRELEASLAIRYERARRAALDDLAEHGERSIDVPVTCPYTIEQILDREWLPANRHGIQDHPL